MLRNLYLNDLLLALFAVLISAACLCSCATTHVINNFCEFYTPVYDYADKVPDDIRLVITQNNAIHYEMCVKQ